jgi:hypothetical protein
MNDHLGPRAGKRRASGAEVGDLQARVVEGDDLVFKAQVRPERLAQHPPGPREEDPHARWAYCLA